MGFENEGRKMYPSQRIVTVCDKCFTETCLKGQFPCSRRLAGEAGSITDKEEDIARLSSMDGNGELVFAVRESPHHGIEAVGPFELYRIVVDGYQVPNLTGRLIDGMWHFTLDSRFGVDVPEKYGHGVAWMIATAQAIGAGYSCFGEDSQPANPFKCRLLGIKSVVTESVIEDADTTRAN